MSEYDITVGDCEGRLDRETELAAIREQIKVMLDELRKQINNLPGTNYTCAGDAVYIPHEVNRAKVLSILDEAEAKL